MTTMEHEGFLMSEPKPSLEAVIAELGENFSILEEWEERYGYLLQLGQELAPFPEAFRTPQWRVEGCVSQVWLVPEYRGDQSLVFLADSDALLVKGLVAIALRLFSGRQIAEICRHDAGAILGNLGLAGFLSPSRSNGFHALVCKIHALARVGAENLPGVGAENL